MRALILGLTSLFIVGAGFPPEAYVTTTRFAAAVIGGDLATARTMMVAEPKIVDWMDKPQSLEDLTKYLNQCPLKGFEGIKQRDINIVLECGDPNESAVVKFQGDKIASIIFGASPLTPVKS